MQRKNATVQLSLWQVPARRLLATGWVFPGHAGHESDLAFAKNDSNAGGATQRNRHERQPRPQRCDSTPHCVLPSACRMAASNAANGRAPLMRTPSSTPPRFVPMRNVGVAEIERDSASATFRPISAACFSESMQALNAAASTWVSTG